MCNDFKSAKECIYSRHSTRNYLPDMPVSEDSLKEILNAGLQAPSPKNSQPWFYYIIQDKKKILQVAEIMEERVSDGIMLKKSRNEPFSALSMALETARIIKTAPALVIVCCEKKHDSSKKGTSGEEPVFTESEMVSCMSIGASVQNMLLMAESLGIDSLWIADILLAREEVSAYLSIRHQIVSAVLFGKAAPSLRLRKALSEKVKWI